MNDGLAKRLTGLLLVCAALAMTGCATGGGGDRNFFRVTGDGAGNIWINDQHALTADNPVREVTLPAVIAPAGYHDALKFSGVRRLRVIVPQVDGRLAAEDAIDVNHCRDLTVEVGELWPGRTYAATIKGASQRVGLTVGLQHGHGRETDFDYGNFSDQGNEKTTGSTLNVTLPGDDVRVRVLTADRPVFTNPGQGYKVDERGQGWFYPVFNFFKDLVAFFKKI